MLVQSIPYPASSYVAPTTDVVFAVQDFASGSATGDQDVTASRISGVTPKAVMSIGVNQDAANSTETADAILSVGWGTSTQGPFAIGNRSRDNQASTSCFTDAHYASSSIRRIISPSAASLVENANSSMIAGGNRFNYSTNDAASRRGVNIYFAGADVSADHNAVNLGTGTSAIDVTAPNFQPDVVLFNHNTRSGSGTLTIWWHSFGICVRDNNGGGVVQRGLFFVEDTNQASARPACTIATDSVAAQLSYGSVGYKVSCGSFDSQGFSLTPSANAGSRTMSYLALKLNGRKCKLVDFTTPTSTGSWSITGVGFLPQCAIAVLTNLETLDQYLDTTDNQSGYSINLIGTDEQWASCVRMDSGADPTDTASNCQNVALLGPSATACDAIKATLTGFNTDGATFNFSAVQGTGKKGFILFIE